MMRMMHPIPISVSLDLSEPRWATAWQNRNPEEQWDGPDTQTHKHAHTHTQCLEILIKTLCQSHKHLHP